MKSKKEKIFLFNLIFVFSLLIPLATKFSYEYKIKNTDKNLLHLSESESIQVVWERIWGGSEDDGARNLVLDSSDNIYLVGVTNSYGKSPMYSNDIVLIKYDNNGNFQWYKTWGGTADEYCGAVVINSFGNIFLAGTTYSFGAGGADMALVKYDENGNQQWNLTWGSSKYDEYCNNLAIDSSNNLYLMGGTEESSYNSNITLVKYDNSGILQWNRSWSYFGRNLGNGMAIDSLDNIYITGFTSSGLGIFDLVLLKYDYSGQLLWDRTWERINDDIGYGIAIDSLDNIYVTGESDYEVLLAKYDNSGVIQWNQTWSGGWTGYDAVVDSLDNVYIAGDTTSLGAGSHDMLLLNYSSSGVLQWSSTWGKVDWDISYSISLDSSNNIYLAGETRYPDDFTWDVALVKFGEVSEKSKPGIPGFDLYIILGIISLYAVIYLRKKK